MRRGEAASLTSLGKHIAAMFYYIWLNSASWASVVASPPRHMLAMHTLMCPQAVGLGSTVSTWNSPLQGENESERSRFVGVR